MKESAMGGLSAERRSLGIEGQTATTTTREVGRPQSCLWAAINAVMAAFFALAALVQINDPDPYIWIPVYLIPAVLCCAIVWSRESVDHLYWRGPALLHMSLCTSGISYLMYALKVEMAQGMFNPLRLEEGRELCGLLIACGWTIMCWCSTYTKSWSSTKLSLTTWLVVLLGLIPLALWGSCYQSNFQHCNDML